MPKHILMLLSNEYRPDPRVEKEARALVESGFDVTVISWDRMHRYPEERIENGVRIVRIRTGMVKAKGDLARNYIFFVSKALKKMKGMHWEVLHSHDLDTLPIGFLAARLHNKPLIFDAHEHYSRMVEDDVPKFSIASIDMLEAMLVRRTDRVIAANQMIAEYLQPHSRSQIIVIMNCIDPPQASREIRVKDELVIFYGGALEPQRYILEIAKVIARLSNVRMRIAGSGSIQEKVEEMASSSGNIEYLGYLDQDRMRDEISSSDLMVAMLDPGNENNRIGTPNRLFEAMALGTPVLTSKGTLSGRIVQEEVSGYVLDWSETGLEDIFKSLRVQGEKQRLGENGIKAVKERYNWNEMRDRLISLYNDL